VVEAEDKQLSSGDSQSKRSSLVKLLPSEYQSRLANLDRRCDKVLEVYRNAQAEEFLIDTSRDTRKSQVGLPQAAHRALSPADRRHGRYSRKSSK